jgi:hypothetical protein
LATAGTASAGGNVTGGNIVTGGVVTATGNVSGANLVTAGGLFAKDALFTGNLTVDGNVTYINIEDLNVQDPVIGLGRGPNNAPLTANDGRDRGTEMWYYVGASGAGTERRAFMGFQNLSGKLIAASNVTLSGDVVTVNQYGTIVVGTLEGAAVSVTGTVTGGNLATAGTMSAGGNVTGANITTAGVITATGNIAGGNITTAGRVTATGNLVTGANVVATGFVTATGNVTGGNLITTGLANVATLEITTLANIKATTAASSTTTGALRVAGGVGVVGNIYAGDIYSTGNLVLTVESTVDGGTY